MSSHHTSTLSDWNADNANSDWMARFGKSFREFVRSFGAGIQAAHDYRRLSAQEGSERASQLVFEKHFSQ